jgi:hypothetical protein
MLSFERITQFYQMYKDFESQDGQKESGRLTRVRKTTKNKNKRHEDPRTPAKVRKSARVKEDCQVSRIRSPRVWNTGTI